MIVVSVIESAKLQNGRAQQRTYYEAVHNSKRTKWNMHAIQATIA